jgi:hypothetical protein
LKLAGVSFLSELLEPPDIADLLLHETAVAWVRKYLKQHPVKIGSDLGKNIEGLLAKLKEAEEHINAFHEVEDIRPEISMGRVGCIPGLLWARYSNVFKTLVCLLELVPAPLFLGFERETYNMTCATVSSGGLRS